MNALPKEYLVLFNAVTDAVKALEELRKALIDAQCQAEYLYINGDLRQSLECFWQRPPGLCFYFQRIPLFYGV